MAPASRAVAAGPGLVLRRELIRKSFHLVAAAFPVAYSLGAPHRVLVETLAAITAVALATETLRLTSPARAAAFDRVFGSLTRPHEQRSITGATWLALSCLAAVLLLSREAAIAALWCATVGDPAAAIGGRLWSLTRTPRANERGGKTLVGSLACALASFAGVWMLAGYVPVAAGLVAAAAAAAEAIPVALDDNIRVAGAAGIVAQLLG